MEMKELTDNTLTFRVLLWLICVWVGIASLILSILFGVIFSLIIAHQKAGFLGLLLGIPLLPITFVVASIYQPLVFIGAVAGCLIASMFMWIAVWIGGEEKQD